MPSKKKKYNARFPPARIKKIMQSDEDVGKVAAPVPVIISRALELFAETLLKKANGVTTARGARTLTPSHLKFCIHSEARFDFLRDMVSSTPELQGDVDTEAPPSAVPADTAPAPRGRGRGRGRGTPRGTGRPRGRPRKVSDGTPSKVIPAKPRRKKSEVEGRYMDDPGFNSDSDDDDEGGYHASEGGYPASPLEAYSASSPGDYPTSPPAHSNGSNVRLSTHSPEAINTYSSAPLSQGRSPPTAHQAVPFNRSQSLQHEDAPMTSHSSLPRTSSYQEPALSHTTPYNHSTRPTYHSLPGHHALPIVPQNAPFRPFASPYGHIQHRGYGSDDMSTAHTKPATGQFGSHKTGINGLFAMDGFYGSGGGGSSVQAAHKLMENAGQSQQSTHQIDEDYDCY